MIKPSDKSEGFYTIYKIHFMAKKMAITEKSAWIVGILGLVGVIITIIFSNGGSHKESNTQKIEKQSVDSGGEIYNAGGDIKVENNTYNGINSKTDSMKKSDTVVKYIKASTVGPISNQKTNIHEQTNVTSINQSGGQTAKEIINNNK